MMMVPFAEYEFEVGSRPDPEWSTYLEFLLSFTAGLSDDPESARARIVGEARRPP